MVFCALLSTSLAAIVLMIRLGYLVVEFTGGITWGIFEYLIQMIVGSNNKEHFYSHDKKKLQHHKKKLQHHKVHSN